MTTRTHSSDPRKPRLGAGSIGQGPQRATKFRPHSRDRIKWMISGWRRPRDLYRQIDDCHELVFPVQDDWSFEVLHMPTWISYNPEAFYATVDEAKLAAFDHLPRNFPELEQVIEKDKSELYELWLARQREQ